MKHQRRTFKEDRHFHNSFTDYSKDFTDYYIVNKPEDGEVAYSIGIWTGSGYYVARFLCFADNEFEAIDRTFEYCNEKYKDQFVFDLKEVEEAAREGIDMYDEYDEIADMEKELEELKDKYSDHVNNLDNWTEYRQAERRMDELEYEIEPLREELIDRYIEKNYVSNEEYTLFAYAENFRIDETPKEIADEILSQNAENLEESKRNRRMMKENVKVFRVYGYDNHRQRESFSPSRSFKTWKGSEIEIFNSDKTGTNNYSELRISDSDDEAIYGALAGQITDGIYENDRVGKITEIVNGKEVEITPWEESTWIITNNINESKRKLPNKRLIERNEKKAQKMRELDSLVCESSNGIFKNEEIKKYADVIIKKFGDIEDFEDFYNNVKDWMSSFGDISEKALAEEYFYEVDELENDDETYRQAIESFIEDVYDWVQEKKEMRESRIRNRKVIKESNNELKLIDSFKVRRDEFSEIGYFGQGTWNDAKEFADNNSEGWRLPNVQEGKEIVKKYRKKMLMITGKYGKFQYPDFTIWTSVDKDDERAFNVFADNGYVSSPWKVKDCYIFCIR